MGTTNSGIADDIVADTIAMRKIGIIVSAAALVAVTALLIYGNLQVRATQSERIMGLDGDDLITPCIGAVNHAITISRPPSVVWPWLAQMGSGRAGWYAYDFIDNGGHHSLNRIEPALQKISVGSILPAMPDAREVFVVVRCEPEHSLVLAWRLPDGRLQTTWEFALTQAEPGQTRLIVRGRVAPGYRPFGLPQWMALSLARPAHFIMERKQLLGISLRAESSQ